MRTLPIVVSIAFVLLLTACSAGAGGSSQGAGSPTVSVMTLHYPSGAKQAVGMGYRAPDNSVVRHGAWTDWYEIGVVHKTGTYVQDVRSASKPWVDTIRTAACSSIGLIFRSGFQNHPRSEPEPPSSEARKTVGLERRFGRRPC